MNLTIIAYIVAISIWFHITENLLRNHQIIAFFVRLPVMMFLVIVLKAAFNQRGYQ